MIAGHYATALVAQQQAPRGHIAYYLVAAQFPDLLWQIFHFVGLEPATPDNIMATSLDNLRAEMTYSHDMLPTLGWIALAIVVGRVLFGAWRPGLAGGALVLVHTVADGLSGYPHHLFGPHSPTVGFGLYASAPYLAVLVEGVFTLAVMGWVVRTDQRAGVRRARATYIVWGLVFGGGLAFTMASANLSIAEVLGVEPLAALAGTTVPTLVITYVLMLGALLWAQTRPVERSARD